LAVSAATVVVLLFALAGILLAWFVFLGRNWARTVAMALSTAAICIQAIDVFHGGPDITLQSNLPGLTLDILLLLALRVRRILAHNCLGTFGSDPLGIYFRRHVNALIEEGFHV